MNWQMERALKMNRCWKSRGWKRCQRGTSKIAYQRPESIIAKEKIDILLKRINEFFSWVWEGIKKIVDIMGPFIDKFTEAMRRVEASCEASIHSASLTR